VKSVQFEIHYSTIVQWRRN